MKSGRPGLSLIEIVVVLLIIGLVMSIAVPSYQNRLPAYKQKEFVDSIGALIALSRQQAIETQKVHRVWFDLPKRIAKVEIETGLKDKDGYPGFEESRSALMSAVYKWSENFVVQQFFVEGAEMIKRPGIKTEEVWLYSVPGGLVQPVIINVVDNAVSDTQGKGAEFSIVVNPFSGRIKKYEMFQKP